MKLGLPSMIPHCKKNIPLIISGLLKQGWNEIPEVLGSTFMALIGIGFAITGCYNYYKNDGDNRMYKEVYTVYRPDDPRAKKIKPIETLPRTQMQSLNGKRPSTQRMQQDLAPNQHDDLIKYIYESWNKISREFESFSQNGADNSKGNPSVVYYSEQEPNPQLKDFEPFDLEAWWGKRVVQNITRTQSS